MLTGSVVDPELGMTMAGHNERHVVVGGYWCTVY